MRGNKEKDKIILVPYSYDDDNRQAFEKEHNNIDTTEVSIAIIRWAIKNKICWSEEKMDSVRNIVISRIITLNKEKRFYITHKLQ